MNSKVSNISIVDIAERTNLSVATVSRVINGFQYVKPETREKVLKVIDELGFTRNAIASSLRSRRTKTIGMIIPSVTMFFHSQVITVVQNELYKKGYNLIIGQSNDDNSIEKKLVQSMLDSRVDALVIATTIHSIGFDNFEVLAKKSIPVVFYDRIPDVYLPFSSLIKGDDYAGGKLAANELIAAGCKRIAAVFGLLKSNLYQDRSKGFLDTLRESKIQSAVDSFFYQELTYDSSWKAMEKLFSGSEVPDGIFFANDTSAIAALQFAETRGIHVPKDLKIIGYSNDPRTTITTPTITSIEQNPQQFGYLVVEKIFEMISEGSSDEFRTKSTIVPVTIERRRSSQHINIKQ